MFSPELQHSSAVQLGCSAAGYGIAAAITNPFDVVKTRMQVCVRVCVCARARARACVHPYPQASYAHPIKIYQSGLTRSATPELRRVADTTPYGLSAGRHCTQTTYGSPSLCGRPKADVLCLVLCVFCGDTPKIPKRHTIFTGTGYVSHTRDNTRTGN